jgi:hypothetical protein
MSSTFRISFFVSVGIPAGWEETTEDIDIGHQV